MIQILNSKGLKKTKPRLSVLNTLKSSLNPMTAEEIYQHCQNDDQSINLSTVYRILDTFLEKGIVIKPFIKDDNKACFTLNHHEHKHYLMCRKCDKMVEIDFCPFENIEKKLESQTNFTITHHKLELFGICPNCKEET